MQCTGLKLRRDAYIERLNGVYGKGWAAAGVTVKEGTARLSSPPEASPKLVEITYPDGSKGTIQAQEVLVAVGGVPSVPDVPGAELGITSDSFFDLPEQPKVLRPFRFLVFSWCFLGVFLVLCVCCLPWL